MRNLICPVTCNPQEASCGRVACSASFSLRPSPFAPLAMSGPSVISVDSSSPASPATPLDAGVPVNQPCEPEPRSRSRSPSIAPTLAQLSPVNPRDYSRASPAPAPHSPAPSLVPAPPSPTLWWTEAEVPALPASPPSPLLWWTEPVGVPPPPPLASTSIRAFSPNAASASSARCPSVHLPCVSACSAPSVKPSSETLSLLDLASVSAAPSAQASSSGRCPPLHLSCVSASSASTVSLVARAAPQPPRSRSPDPNPLIVNVVPFSLSTTWVPPPELVNNARIKRGRVVVGGRINWPRTLPPFGTPFDDCLHYAVGECKRLVGEERDFYIGATRDPYDRFWGWEDHKHHHTWRNMWVVGQSTNIGIRRLETEVIDADIGRAHPLCAAPGGVRHS